MAHPHIPRSTLLQATIDALRHRPRTLTIKMIAEDTGFKQNWLSGLLSDDPPEPSVNACVALYEYLTKTTITL